MRTLLILGLCATAMVANAQTAKIDTVTMYVINGEFIKNFNGSQLSGKTIKTYFIDTTESWNNRVIVGHAITTTDAKPVPGQGIRITNLDAPAPNKVIISKDNGGQIVTRIGEMSDDGSGKTIFVSGDAFDEFLTIVDGVEGAPKPSDNNIASITAFGPDSKEAAAYGEKGKNGIVLITTKKMGQESAEQIVVIDGKKSTDAELKALDSKKIESITVLKGKAAKEYTDNPNVGVVIVTTKKK